MTLHEYSKIYFWKINNKNIFHILQTLGDPVLLISNDDLIEMLTLYEYFLIEMFYVTTIRF